MSRKDRQEKKLRQAMVQKTEENGLPMNIHVSHDQSPSPTKPIAARAALQRKMTKAPAQLA